MSEIDKMICDNCKTVSEDICGDPGWISFNWVSKEGLVVAVSEGRDGKTRNHKCKSYKESKENIDFCCTQCMLEWMGLLVPVEPHGFIIYRVSENN